MAGIKSASPHQIRNFSQSNTVRHTTRQINVFLLQNLHVEKQILDFLKEPSVFATFQQAVVRFQFGTTNIC